MRSILYDPNKLFLFQPVETILLRRYGLTQRRIDWINGIRISNRRDCRPVRLV